MMRLALDPFRLLLISLAGWLNQQQQEGHTDHVADVAFSPDGKWLATASSDLTAKVWDAATGNERLTLRGHKSWVLGVAFSPDGRRLATGSEDDTARIWDASSGKTLFTLAEHTDKIFGVAFSPDGARLATADAGAALVYAWGVKELMQLAQMSRPLIVFDEFPPGYPSAGCSPAEPASVSPGGFSVTPAS
jgi:WD40 repeat protein